MLRALWHTFMVLILTLVTQIGGVVWALSLLLTRRSATPVFLAAFLISYGVATAGAHFVAPNFGRVPIPCSSETGKARSLVFYCLTNRNYIAPEVLALLDELSQQMSNRYPETEVRILDANLPFWDGFPLLPHLSHDDGQKVDLAFWYQDDADRLRSPIGYFAFEEGPTECRKTWPTLRWDMAFLQPYFLDLPLDAARTGFAVKWLAKNAPQGSKILIEPHLKSSLGLTHPGIRFQGCRAARHDDHIHFQVPK